MMLEIINRDPPLTYLDIVKAATVPAVLYYLSIFLLVHFYAQRTDVIARKPPPPTDVPPMRVFSFEGLTFFGALGGLMGFLLAGYSPFRAVTYALAILIVMIILSPRTAASRVERWSALAGLVALVVGARYGITLFRLLSSIWASAGGGELPLPVVGSWDDAIVVSLAEALVIGLALRAWRGTILTAFMTAARGGIPLIVAAACVGIIIGLVARTGIGTGLPQAIIPLAGNSLFLALVAIMCCSLVLGMGLPSAVSYLLLATIIGPIFADPALEVPILAAHLFIFYFGMMAMVTPPVALAAYATASLAGASVMQTGFASFRFALVGFTLPYMFVYRPELLLIGMDGGTAPVWNVVVAIVAASLGILALAAAMAGFLFHRLGWGLRAALYVAASAALFPDQWEIGGYRLPIFDLLGITILAIVSLISWRRRASRPGGVPDPLPAA